MQKNNKPKKSELEKYRLKIDKIDKELIQNLAKRFNIVRKIGEYKKKHNLPALDKKRWQEVLSSRVELAKSLGLPEKLIKKIYNTIHEFALKLEDELKNGKT